MVGNRPAGGNQRLAGRALDSTPLGQKFAMPPESVECEIGCRSIGIDVGEPAGDLSWSARGFADCRFGRGFDLVVKGFETFPGDRGLELVGDDRPPDQVFTGIGHADEGVSPQTGGALAMRIGLVLLLGCAGMV